MSELIIVSAADEPSLLKEMTRLIGFLDRVPEVALADIAYTCSLNHGECVIAVIADDVNGLRARLASARDRIAAGSVSRLRDKSGTYYFRKHLLGPEAGRLAFVYPGVMSFYPDMMRDLAIENPACRGAFDELEEALVSERDFTPSSFIFPPAAYYRHDADVFRSGAYAEALVSTYAGGVALTRLLKECGLNPDGVVGFAGGDLAAMMRSGAAGEHPSRPERVRIIRDIYQIVRKAVNHGGLPEVAMITVLLRRGDELGSVMTAFSPEEVMLAVDFSPRQKTFAVAKTRVPAVKAALAAAGIRAMELDLDRPFNTPLCATVVPAIRKFATSWMKYAPVVDIYSCATAAKLPPVLKTARDDTAERWEHPVRFAETIRQMYADGYRVFLEVGPRGLMTAAVSDTLRGEEHAAIALNSIHRRGLLQIQHAIGQLMALGAKMDISGSFERRHANRLDFDAVLSLEVRKDAERKLSRSFPRLTLLGDASSWTGGSAMMEAKGRGAKAASRAAALAQNARRQRQFDFGAVNPLVSDADTLESIPRVMIELTKEFRLSELPFICDYALGTSQMSYSDPNLHGLITLRLPVGAEIMAETALMLMPNRSLLRIENLWGQRMISFERGATRLFIRAEQVPSQHPSEVAVKVILRDDKPDSAYTSPAMEATFVLTDKLPLPGPLQVESLSKPRSVHWSGREIYPMRLCCGQRLRGIQFAETWSESGIDYEVEVPPLAGNVKCTRFPLWCVNPLLLEIITGGFPLWRSHERFAGAFSFPFRLRRMTFSNVVPAEGERLKCYLRLTGVTPTSHLCDITVSDGNGKELMTISGWEEHTERVPVEYRDLILQPATTFLTEALDGELLGEPATDVASAFITDIPYAIFERNDGRWLKTISHIVLDNTERRAFADMPGAIKRRTEWLFGRIAAKEAVRRFLKDFYQARWSDADIPVWPNEQGKPRVFGAWRDYLATKLNIAIAHTSQFVVALAAANARVGVDVEMVSRNLADDFANAAFTPEELERAAQTANSSQSIIRFWCAKEAVSKALGTGIRYSPRELVIADYQADSGVITVRLEGAWLEVFKNFRGRDIPVTVKTVRDHALASCFIPASLLPEEDDE